ncbi:hypothetical protein H5410_059606 [Solanum commersonii]|uniref:Uncharacterized protein n=1 Tax=Solanum commersonii TaxID=4109 RepID=A0A9J5W3F8_SOLCO|nr:hypothetical protein H5410_059606 [Solanum commersonii]
MKISWSANNPGRWFLGREDGRFSNSILIVNLFFLNMSDARAGGIPTEEDDSIRFAKKLVTHAKLGTIIVTSTPRSN